MRGQPDSKQPDSKQPDSLQSDAMRPHAVGSRFVLQHGDAPHTLIADVIRVGRDAVVAIHGGDAPHVGAVALGTTSPGAPGTREPAHRTAGASILAVPGHKEDMLAREAALRLSGVLDSAVVVSMGMHWDGLDREGIRTVETLCRELVERIAARLEQTETTA